MEQENEEKKGAGNAMESSAAAKSSENEIPKSLKARSKIAKKWPINDLKAKKAKIAARAWSRFRKKKKRNLLDEKNDNNSIEGEGSKKLNSREENLNENLLKEKDPKTSQQCKKNQEEIGGLDKNHRKQRGEEEIGGADKNLWKQGGEQKIPGSDKSLKNQKEKEKQRDAGRSQEKEMRKDKLGGLIFMCSKKTKPDCFHYHVMGVSGSRKDLVLGIKPGLKLFLYDFDLKFMYGIYKASSSGGMKLEPKAFGGAFPAQVHFDVHRDCLPLPESIFRKAIEENYDEKHKFKIELTPRQVRKLSELFRPVAAHSTALPVLTTPVPKVQDREVHLGVRESNWEKFARDPYANASSRNCSGLSSERDRRITYGKGSSLREEVPNDLCMTEKEYRAPLNLFQRGHETGQDHLLRHPDPTYSDTIPVSREPVRADALRVTEREYQTYNVGSRHELPSRVSPVATTLDSYHREPYSTYYYGASSVDPYLPLPRREDITSGSYSAAGRRENYLVGTDPLRRGETDQADRLYSSYATSALSNYSRQHLYEGRKLDLVAAPVSSRIPKPNVGKPSVLGNSRNSTKKRKRKSVIESDESSEGVDVEVQEKDGKYSRRNFVHDACQQHRRSSRQRQNVLYSEKITDGDSFSSPKRSKGSKPDRSSGEELQEAGVRGGLSKDGTSSERDLKQKASSIEESMPNKNSNTREHKAEGKEADISACDNGSTWNPAIIEYPDPDFNDFDKIREENCFAVNQTWAIYDPCDGMPRFYARIKKVFSPHFRLQITWLEPNPDDESEKAWCDVELPIGCGKFINGKTEDTEDRLMFSHQKSSIRSVGRRSFLIYPKVGETWAIFSDWDIKWGSDPEKHRPPYQYEFVEVLTDFDENVGIGVAYLGKVNGFVSLFKQTAHHGVISFSIAPAHMYKFSHQIPSYKMTGKEREGVPVGSFEFDPASLPTSVNKLDDPDDVQMEKENLVSKSSGLSPASAKGKEKPTMDSKKTSLPKRPDSDPEGEHLMPGRSATGSNRGMPNCNQVDAGQCINDKGCSEADERIKTCKKQTIVCAIDALRLRRSPRDLGKKKDQLNVSQCEVREEVYKHSDAKKVKKQSSILHFMGSVSSSHYNEKMHLHKKGGSSTSVKESYNAPSSPSTVHKIADAVCYDFKAERSEDKFEFGQIWALYSDVDGMPRNYAQVKRIETSDFRLHVVPLEACSPSNALNQPVCCGTFIVNGKTKVIERSAFSHQVKADAIGENRFEIYPRKGQVWAVYKKGNSELSVSDWLKHERDIVEILEDREQNIKVAILSSVNGYKSVYRIPRSQRSKTRFVDIPQADLSRFSHQIPAFHFTREKSYQLSGCWNLDPLAIPGATSGGTIILD